MTSFCLASANYEKTDTAQLTDQLIISPRIVKILRKKLVSIREKALFSAQIIAIVSVFYWAVRCKFWFLGQYNVE